MTAPRPEAVAASARFSDLTTLRVGGPIRDYVRAETEEAVIAALSEPADGPVFLLGGGSNVLASDDEFPGRVVHVVTQGMEILGGESEDAAVDPGSGDEGVLVRVAAGVAWDDFVASTLDAGLAGLEALSGIPGSAGATPVQNVGAYGAEVAHSIVRVRAWDAYERRIVVLGNFDCGFGYRDSLFKRASAASAGGIRYAVLDATFRLSRDPLSAPIRYAELARTLGTSLGGRARSTAVRDAVLRLRAGKGMVLDPRDPDTFSAGSFFTNPILPDGAELPEGAPAWPMPEGGVKTSAAWLIDHAGFAKGFGIDPARASLSTKHTLALTNRGGASTADLLALARVVRDGVAERYGIILQAEPALVGVAL